jgi:hypothetical protein
MFSPSCRIALLIAKIEQGAEVAIGLKNDITSLAAISPIRTTFGHELLPSEADAAPPSITSLDKNSGFIDKH